MASNQNDPARPGNEFFVRNEYEKALEAYSTAIAKYPDMAELYSNRALTYLKLDRPFRASKDVEIGLKLDPDNDKLIYRKCKALLAMRRFHEAEQFLHESIRRLFELTKKKEFKAMIEDTNRLKLEYEYGQYDLLAMVEEAKKSNVLDHHADYIAWNKFEIREIDGKGRGLVAKEKVELGDLLIACNAIVFVPISEQFDDHFRIILDEVRTKLLERPDLAKEFFRLYAGPHMGHLENWTEGESMDLGRITGVVACNSYPDCDVLFNGSMIAVARHVGINFVPSYINHTCVDFNCARYFVGNFTFVRATKAIEKGDELVLSYIRPDVSFEDRQQCFDGFVCHCRLCQAERHDSIDVKERLDEIRRFLSCVAERAIATRTYHPSDVQLLKRFADELQYRRPGLASFDYLAFRVRGALASGVLCSDPKASIPMLKKLIDDLKSAGDFLEALFVSKSLRIAARDSGSKRQQDGAKKVAREIAKMFFGDERVADL